MNKRWVGSTGKFTTCYIRLLGRGGGITMGDQMDPHITLCTKAGITNSAQKRPQLQMAQLAMAFQIALPLKSIWTHITNITLIALTPLGNACSTPWDGGASAPSPSARALTSSRRDMMDLLLMNLQGTSRTKRG